MAHGSLQIGSRVLPGLAIEKQADGRQLSKPLNFFEAEFDRILHQHHLQQCIGLICLTR